MGRPKAPPRLILTPVMLDHLEGMCADREAAWTHEAARVELRTETVRELIRMARFGRGLAALNARSDAERSAAARKASQARWAARDHRRHVELHERWRTKIQDS